MSFLLLFTYYWIYPNIFVKSSICNKVEITPFFLFCRIRNSYMISLNTTALVVQHNKIVKFRGQVSCNVLRGNTVEIFSGHEIYWAILLSQNMRGSILCQEAEPTNNIAEKITCMPMQASSSRYGHDYATCISFDSNF